MKTCTAVKCKNQFINTCGISISVSNIKMSIYKNQCRGGSRTAATSKMERLVIIVNGWKPLTIITKRSILDVAAVLDPPLQCMINSMMQHSFEDNAGICQLTVVLTHALLSFLFFQPWFHSDAFWYFSIFLVFV